MIQSILIDDEKLALQTLKWQLEEFCEGIEVIEVFDNPIKATEFLRKNEIDLCFLDIEMPEMSGFEFLKQWENIPFDLIFTTAYNQFAIQAFRASACDYLLKPIDEDDLVDALEKYKKRFYDKGKNQNNHLNQQLQALSEQLQNPISKEKIPLPTAEGVHIVAQKDIIRLEADKNYTHIFCKDGKQVLVSKTIKDLESSLNPSLFIRIHQSHIINLDCVSLYKKGKSGGSITLEDNTLLPVSKSKKEDLMEKLGLL
ncbi:LytR/AlgR family response regulator transcription factor [Bernardetia sp.]|uniref:LytR/AlgR family response regulator transcription factor n=1 Tax=Bernardetia sp. TaxID=1937974 RepID=UPI0025BB7C05|nr:LytTR family DNA-binding domain-containing protein [Bernardetia sp.]